MTGPDKARQELFEETPIPDFLLRTLSFGWISPVWAIALSAASTTF